MGFLNTSKHLCVFAWIKNSVLRWINKQGVSQGRYQFLGRVHIEVKLQCIEWDFFYYQFIETSIKQHLHKSHKELKL